MREFWRVIKPADELFLARTLPGPCAGRDAPWRGAADTPQLPVSMAGDTARDRRALELILGHPVRDEPWPQGALPAGTAVRVTREPGGHAAWRSEFTGVIDRAMAPRAVQDKHARPGELEYLVRFGTPQHDSAAGGPYRKAMIWDRYLKPL